MKDIRLSQHFLLSEFTRSATATRHNVDNTLASTGSPQACLEVISNLQSLCDNVLEPLRSFINSSDSPSPLSFRGGAGGEASIGGAGGEAPLVITSGYRCTRLNTLVGGAARSQHITGEAADIHIPDLATGRKWMQWIVDHLTFDQLIMEHSKSGTHWLHVSFRQDIAKNRRQVIADLQKS